jgi:hypothetical protein
MWLATFTTLYSSGCTVFLFSVMHNAFMWVYAQYKAYRLPFLDIILCSVFYLKKNSETGLLSLSSGKEPIQFDPINRASLYLWTPEQMLGRIYKPHTT